MGAADSRLISPEGVADVIETIRDGRGGEEVDACAERLQKLRVAGPTLRSPGEESSFTAILWQPKLSGSDSVEYAALDASSSAEALSVYQEWQRRSAAKVSKKQEEIGFKIDAAEAVAMKLLQRLNYSASVMKTSAAHLEEAEYVKVEVREMKRALNIVLGNYEALCKRVEAQGPEFLQRTRRASSRASSGVGAEVSLGGALQQMFRTGSSAGDGRAPQ